jgi:hypothetical protein
MAAPETSKDRGVLGAELLQLGFRKNYVDLAGIQLRSAVGAYSVFGPASISDVTSTSSSASDAAGGAYSLGVVLLPYFGPFGRFYFGPELWATYWWYERLEVRRTASTAPYQTTTFNVALPDGWLHGLGMVMGIFAGRLEQFDIWWGFRVGNHRDRNTDELGWVSLTAGLAGNVPL